VVGPGARTRVGGCGAAAKASWSARKVEFSARAVEIHGHARDALTKARRVEHEPPVLRHVAAAVEHEAVVRADEVRVRDGRLVVARAGRDHLAARTDDAEAKRRRREVEHELGPCLAAAPHGPVRRPSVLAHLERHGAEVELEDEVAEGHAADLIDEPRSTASERARFVEHVVRGELLLGDDAEDAPPEEQRGGVVELPRPLHRDPDGDRAPRAFRLPRQPLEALPLGVDEGPPLDEIFLSVAAHHLLWQYDHGGVLGGGGPDRGDAAIDVPSDGPHGRVHGGQGDADEPHFRPQDRTAPPIPDRSIARRLAPAILHRSPGLGRTTLLLVSGSLRWPRDACDRWALGLSESEG
jgi:hypothetical protein